MTEDLRDRLDLTLSAVVPAPPPVEQVIRRGKRIRWRRRALATTGAVAVAAAALVIPISFHPQASPGPASGNHGDGGYTATVVAPGVNAGWGLVASGTINGLSWQFTVTPPIVNKDTGEDRQTVTASGPAFAHVQRERTGLLDFGTRTAPLSFMGLASGRTVTYFGAVWTGVDKLTVRLTNGATLTLVPTAEFGQRLVAFAVPAGAVVVDVTAYTQGVPLATATPYFGQQPVAQWGPWLEPGAHGLPSASGRIGAGSLAGQSWSASASTGPFGACITLSGTPMCLQQDGTSIVTYSVSGPLTVFAGEAVPAVTRIVVHGPPGQIITVRPVTIGRYGFFAFATRFSAGKTTLHWIAYDTAGHEVASGTATD